MTDRETINFQPDSLSVRIGTIAERIEGIRTLNQQFISHTVGVAAAKSTVDLLEKNRFQTSDMRNHTVTRVNSELADLINSGALPLRDSLALYFDFNSVLPNPLPQFECEKISNLIDTLHPQTPVVLFTSPWHIRHASKQAHCSAGVLRETPTLTLWKSGDSDDPHKQRLSMELELVQSQNNTIHASFQDFDNMAVGHQIPRQYAKYIDQYVELAKTVKDNGPNGQLLLPIPHPIAGESIKAAVQVTAEIFTHLPDIAQDKIIQERSRELANQIREFTTLY